MIEAHCAPSVHMKSGSRLHTFDHADVQNWFFAVGSRLGPVPGQLFSLNSGYGCWLADTFSSSGHINRGWLEEIVP
jgi:hypothetical protein